MPKYETALTRSETVAEGTMAFHFAKPAGFKFTAGQSMNVSLIDPPESDAKGNSRTFSIVSAPHENELVIATRMRDTAFKRVLKGMPPGGRVGLRGPAGMFTLDPADARPAAYLAGGIGITPFVSMLRSKGYDWVLSIEHEDSYMSVPEGFSKAVSYLRGVLIREPPGKAWWF